MTTDTSASMACSPVMTDGGNDNNSAAAATATIRTEPPRPYKCPLCDKAFHRLEHQTRHIRTHTGEKPHACPHPGCPKRFSRSDELTRHARIHSNAHSKRANKHQAAVAHAAAAAAISGALYDHPAIHHPVRPLAQLNPLGHTGSPSPPDHSMPPPSSSFTSGARSAPGSRFTSPEASPRHSYATYASTPATYTPRNASGDVSPAPTNPHSRGPSAINLLATAASQVERESTYQANTFSSSFPHTQHLVPPARYNHTYYTGRMPSLSSYHYTSNPTSHPMSRSQSHEDLTRTDDHDPSRFAKRTRPSSPQSTAPPSPDFSHGSTPPTPDHTPLATPSHSPRIRSQYHPSGIQLPTLHHLSLYNQHHHHQLPPPTLAPVEPATDATAYCPAPSQLPSVPYLPAQHTGLRISDIIDVDDGARRTLPLPLSMGSSAKDPASTNAQELASRPNNPTHSFDQAGVHFSNGAPFTGPSGGRGTGGGVDLYQRM